MAAKVERQFDAAVNVIKCLPKNGPFQPSYDMMKRFYGLYKQATEGPCDKAKPGFWDVVGRQKWDAWSKLGDMTKQEAMKCYVDELKKIVETMPHTPEVSKFVNNLGPFFESVHENGTNDDENENTPKLANGDVNDTHPLVVPPEVMEVEEKSRDEANYEVPENQDQESESSSSEAIDEEEEDEEEETDDVDDDDEDDEEKLVDGTTEEVLTESTVVVPEPVTVDNKAFVVEVAPTVEVTKPVKKPKKESESEDENGFVRINGMNGTNGTNATPLLSPPSVTSDTDSGDEIFLDSMEKQNLEDNSEIPTLIALKSSSYNPTTSTPNKTQFTVQAEVYSEKPNVTFRTPEVSHVFDGKDSSEAVVARGGGANGEGDSGQSTSYVGQRGGGAAGQGGIRGSGRGEGQRSPSRTPLRPSGSSGGSGGRGGRQHSPPKVDVNEQIAVALERLQQDMNSVLIRLNTLETLSLRNQAEAQQSGMWSTREQSSSPSWWPFNNLSGKTVFFIIVWPFVVRWVIKLLKRRRGPRS